MYFANFTEFSPGILPHIKKVFFTFYSFDAVLTVAIFENTKMIISK